MGMNKYLYVGLMAICLGTSCSDDQTPEIQEKEENNLEPVYIPGVITEDGYNAVVWIDGKAHFV